MKTLRYPVRKGIALLAAMVFIIIFSAISIGFLSLSSANTQTSVNHRKSNNALNAALSGLDCAMYIVQTTATIPTSINTVTAEQADMMWNNLYTRLGAVNLGNAAETKSGSSVGSIITTSAIPYGNNGGSFQIFFHRDNVKVIRVESVGTMDGITRKVRMNLDIKKDASVLNFALAGRGRMWLTGDTTIHGSIYSSWDVASISPFNITSDSTVEGSINTVLTEGQVDAQSYQLETKGANGNPMFDYGCSAFDINGNAVAGSYGPVDEYGFLLDNNTLTPVYDEEGNRIPATYANRVTTSSDEVQGYHEGINYGQPDQSSIPGLNIGDYNTSAYRTLANYGTPASVSSTTITNGNLPTAGYSTVTEYFPHAAGNYTQSVSGSRTLTRRIYDGKTLRNVAVTGGTNALFRNCTFEEVLYVDCSGTGTGTSSSNYNNVRFENCTFNGVIVTNTPQSLTSGWWQKNCLYFTGAATFQNNSSIPEATILAPHFNVNLGNTNPNEGDNNVLTGAIVGGIVDVRGNAEINGTIISMADTTAYSSGYVTNIGATENDGGSETTEAGDIGTIEITPNPEQMLPSGITSPVIFDPNSATYAEYI